MQFLNKEKEKQIIRRKFYRLIRKRNIMKKIVLMFISVLACVVILTNCKTVEQKENLVLTSEVVFVDRENDEVVSRENVDYDAFIKWVCDSIQKRASTINGGVIADRKKDEIVSRENIDYDTFVKWVRDSIQKRASIVE